MEKDKKWLVLLFDILLGLTVFNWFIPSVEAWPQDRMHEFKTTTALYDDMGMRIRQKQSKSASPEDPFNPQTGTWLMSSLNCKQTADFFPKI